MLEMSNSVGDSKPGVCALIYGPFSCGKTHALGTLPGSVGVINTEPRDERNVLGQFGDKITNFRPEGSGKEKFDDIMAKGYEWSVRCTFDNIAIDSGSFLMADFKSELQDDRLEDRISENKTKGELLTDLFNLVDKDWGVMAEMMRRVTKLFCSLSHKGVNVIFTATVIESPSWNRSIMASPNFMGREYPRSLNGYFDLIGFVTKPWKLMDDGTVKPPTVSFVSPDDESYIAVCRSIPLAKKNPAPLDWTKILKVVKGE